MAAVTESVIGRWFTPEFRSSSPEVVEKARTLLKRTPPEGYVGACAALRDADERSNLATITAPTLVITGSRDPATPPADGRAVAGAIRGARCVELQASHLSNLEAAQAFTAEVVSFLTAGPGQPHG